MHCRRLLTLAALLLALPAASLAYYQARTYTIGGVISDIVVDSQTGRAFVAASSGDRSWTGSVAVLEPDGTISSLGVLAMPGQMAIARTARKLIVPHPGTTTASVVDLATYARTEITTGFGPGWVVISEQLNRAYIVGQNNQSSNAAPWLNPGTLSGSVTELDLLTMQTRIVTLPMLPRQLAIDAAAGRVYVSGVNYLRTGESMPGYIQVYDVHVGSMIGTPLQLGRLPSDLVVAPGKGELYILGNVETVLSQYSTNDPRRNGILPVVWVLDGQTLATKRMVNLPERTSVGTAGGNLAHDPGSGRLYALDRQGSGFSIIDPASGAHQVVPLEAAARRIAFDPGTNQVLAHLAALGYAAILSGDGQRLDSVPLTRAARPGESLNQRFARNESNGEVFVANAHDGTVTVLRDDPATPALLNVTDLWWNPSESGWGVYLEQQGTTLFAAMFVERADGAPAWYVMSEGKRRGDGSFHGPVFRTGGPLTTAGARLTDVGTMTFTPRSQEHGQLSYDIGETKRTVTVSRQAFAAERSCGWKVAGSGTATNYTSLWFDPTQPGWGIAVSHRGNTVFGVLFAYDGTHQPTWAAMSNGALNDAGSFTGHLYRSTGKAVSAVGTMALTFRSPNEGRVTYEADGVTVTRALSRQVFAALVSDCL